MLASPPRVVGRLLFLSLSIIAFHSLSRWSNSQPLWRAFWQGCAPFVRHHRFVIPAATAVVPTIQRWLHDQKNPPKGEPQKVGPTVEAFRVSPTTSSTAPEEPAAKTPALQEEEPHSYMFGYYDKHQVDSTNSRILMGRISLPKDTEPGERDEMVVGWAGVAAADSTKFVEIGRTTAFNLQQGSMMEWVSPVEVVFNVRRGGISRTGAAGAATDRTVSHNNSGGLFYAQVFQARCFTDEDCDFKNWLPTQKYSRPVYAWSRSSNRFASISMERLHNLRRGYGYTVPEVEPERCPEDDGIWIVDVGTGAEELLISYAELRSLWLSFVKRFRRTLCNLFPGD